MKNTKALLNENIRKTKKQIENRKANKENKYKTKMIFLCQRIYSID